MSLAQVANLLKRLHCEFKYHEFATFRAFPTSDHLSFCTACHPICLDGFHVVGVQEKFCTKIKVVAAETRADPEGGGVQGIRTPYFAANF